MPAIPVVFLEEPVVGRCALFVQNGQRMTSSPVLAVAPDPTRPGWYSVRTSNGSEYCGPVNPDLGLTTAIPPASLRWSAVIQSLLPPNRPVPQEIARGLNWGAFLLAPFWSGAHRVWIGLMCLLPYVGVVMWIVLLFKGNEWGWQCRDFKSVEHFRAVQRIWAIWGVIVACLVVVVVVALFLFPFGLVWFEFRAIDDLFESPTMQVTIVGRTDQHFLGVGEYFTAPDPGTRFIVFTVSVRNTGRKRAHVSNNDFELICDNKRVYQPEDIPSVTGLYEVEADLLPGGTATGHVVFQVENGVEPVGIECNPSPF